MASCEETDRITEALIREYLTRKGLAGTLQLFNSEKPTLSTQHISKRSELVSLLGLEAAAARQKHAQKAGQPAAATLELLVEHQLQKLLLTQQEPCSPAVIKMAPCSGSTTTSGSSSSYQHLAAGQAQSSSQMAVLPEAPLVAASRSCTDQGAMAAARHHMVQPPERPDSAYMQSNGAGRPVSGRPHATGQGQHAPSQQTVASPAAAVPAQHELLVEDVADIDLDDADAAAHPIAAPRTSRGHVGSGASVGAAPCATGMRQQPPGQPLPPEQQRQLVQLLWGGHGAPPPSWQQGLFFSEALGLSWGLVQMQGGPCGVLAALQGFVLVALQAQSCLGHQLHPTPEQRHKALAEAIADVLWQARPGGFGSGQVVCAAGSGGGLQRLTYDQLNRECVVRSASSRLELVALVRSVLPQLCEPRGWGVLLLLHSLLLTRGVDVIRQDTDEPDSSLVGPHGYCTSELVNLVLVGAATSNVFDGQRSLGPGSLLRGVSRRGKVGMLTLFEWYRYVEVGANLKSPHAPFWVVCSESHYSILFVMPDEAHSNGSLQPPLKLSYYDGLANQEGPIMLEILPAAGGVGWTTRLAGVTEERGVWQGRPVPPLELVIETKWPDVAVKWLGCEPLL